MSLPQQSQLSQQQTIISKTLPISSMIDSKHTSTISSTNINTNTATTADSTIIMAGQEQEAQPQSTEQDTDEPEIDFTCNVCRIEDADEDNPLVICDKCYICVHRECYGSPLLVTIPDGEWFCDRCNGSAETYPCALCPTLLGVMKRTTDYRWCHLSCAQWIPEVFFRLPDNRELIDYLTVPSHRFENICTFCKSKYGATLTCSNVGCTTTFHITCGMDNDIYFEYKTSSKGADVINALCPEHAKKWKVKVKRG